MNNSSTNIKLSNIRIQPIRGYISVLSRHKGKETSHTALSNNNPKLLHSLTLFVQPSVGKYKFKFASDAEEPVDTTKLKRGYALEVVPIEEEVKPQPEKTENIISSRMTRTSRGEYGIDYRDQTSKIASELSTVRVR